MAKGYMIDEEIELGIKIGDLVKVTRSAISHEGGWNNSWIRIMDDAVGNIYTIKADHGSAGWELSFSNGRYAFPSFVLEMQNKDIKKTNDIIEKLCQLIMEG